MTDLNLQYCDDEYQKKNCDLLGYESEMHYDVILGCFHKLQGQSNCHCTKVLFFQLQQESKVSLYQTCQYLSFLQLLLLWLSAVYPVLHSPHFASPYFLMICVSCVAQEICYSMKMNQMKRKIEI